MALTNEQYNTLMRQYSARQAQNNRQVTHRKEELYNKLPQLAQLDDLHAQYTMQQLEFLLEGQTAEAEEMRAKVRSVSSQKEQLIQNAGFPSNYLEPTYTCSHCKDTGFINNQRCRCFIQASIKLIYSQSHIENTLCNKSFDDFDLSLYSKEPLSPTDSWSPFDYAKDSFDKCQKFVQNFDTTGGNLLLSGNTGIGKTFLSSCVAKAMLDSNHSVVYFTATQFFNIFDFNNKGQAADNEREQVSNCELLIIDDLGTELSTAFTNAQLFACLNDRLLNGKSTLISTNLSVFEIRDRYSERVSSRILQSYTPCPLYGEDIRIKIAQKNKKGDFNTNG